MRSCGGLEACRSKLGRDVCSEINDEAVVGWEMRQVHPLRECLSPLTTREVPANWYLAANKCWSCWRLAPKSGTDP
jgi:hypothetical protein